MMVLLLSAIRHGHGQYRLPAAAAGLGEWSCCSAWSFCVGGCSEGLYCLDSLTFSYVS